MTPVDPWSIASGPTFAGHAPGGALEECYAFGLVRGDETAKVTVCISGSATADNPYERIALAGETNGRSEVERILNEDQLPRRIFVWQDHVTYEAG